MTTTQLPSKSPLLCYLLLTRKISGNSIPELLRPPPLANRKELSILLLMMPKTLIYKYKPSKLLFSIKIDPLLLGLNSGFICVLMDKNLKLLIIWFPSMNLTWKMLTQLITSFLPHFMLKNLPLQLTLLSLPPLKLLEESHIKELDIDLSKNILNLKDQFTVNEILYNDIF